MKRKSSLTPLEIIEKNCLLNGTSMEDRLISASRTLYTNRMLPIAVNPNKGIVLFPTCSARSVDCQWFSYYHVKQCNRLDHETCISFTEIDDVVSIKISEKAFDIQYKKAGEIIAKHVRSLVFRNENLL